MLLIYLLGHNSARLGSVAYWCNLCYANIAMSEDNQSQEPKPSPKPTPKPDTPPPEYVELAEPKDSGTIKK